MKRSLLLLLVIATSMSLSAQSDKYKSAMKKFVVALDSAKTSQDLTDLSNNFERVANAEKNQWLPWYYAAYSLVMRAYQEKDVKVIDGLMDKADEFLIKAELLATDNSEVTLLKSMTVQVRMSADQSRYMTLGPKTTKLIKQSEAQMPKDNPRAYFMEAQMTYYTPEAFGGGKEKGIALMKKSVALFSSFQPESEIHPNWGKAFAASTLESWSK